MPGQSGPVETLVIARLGSSMSNTCLGPDRQTRRKMRSHQQERAETTYKLDTDVLDMLAEVVFRDARHIQHT